MGKFFKCDNNAAFHEHFPVKLNIVSSGQHDGAEVSTVASQQEEGAGFTPSLGPFSVEFACSPRLHWVPPTVLRLIGGSKLV